MLEFIRFRLATSIVMQLVPIPGMKRIGNDLCEISLAAADPRLAQLGTLHREAISKGNFSYGFFEFDRKYSDKEIDEARFFRLVIEPTFRPTGEECGTLFDEAPTCGFCGSGRVQLTRLRLDTLRLPKRPIIQSFAGEIVVSSEVREAIELNGLSGVKFLPVADSAGLVDAPHSLEDFPSGQEIILRAERQGVDRRTSAFYDWLNSVSNHSLLASLDDEVQTRYRVRRKPLTDVQLWQLLVTADPVHVSPRTSFGIDLWGAEEPTQELCPLGHNYGFRLLSEVHLVADSHDGSDFVVSERNIGSRQGLFMPRPILIVSKKAFDMLRGAAPTSFGFDVVNVDRGI